MSAIFDPLLGKLRSFDSISPEDVEKLKQIFAQQEGIYPKLYAGNLVGYTTDGITSILSGSIIRTTGGDASVADGEARITQLRGNVVNGIPFTAHNLLSIYFNLFDKSHNIIEGATISGTQIISGEHTLGWCHVVRGEISTASENETNNGIRIKTSEGTSILAVGFSTGLPTIGSTIIPLTEQSTYAGRSVYVAPEDGYLVFEIDNNIENVLVQNAWSHDADEGAEAKSKEYSENILALPLIRHKDGLYFLAKANAIYDELNGLTNTAIQRVDRAKLCELQWTETPEIHVINEGEENEENYTTYTYTASIPAKPSTTQLEGFFVPEGFIPTINNLGEISIYAGTTQLDINNDPDWANAIIYFELASYIETEIGEMYYNEGDYGLEMFTDYLDEPIPPLYSVHLYLTDMKGLLRDMALREEKSRSYTIICSDGLETLAVPNNKYAYTIKSIDCHNISTLFYSIGTIVHQAITITDGKADNLNIVVPAHAVITFEIGRTEYNNPASATITFDYN